MESISRFMDSILELKFKNPGNIRNYVNWLKGPGKDRND